MKKKLSLALISVAILITAMFATQPIPVTGSPGIYHYKVILAQKNCTAWMTAYFTINDVPIVPNEHYWPGVPYFELFCNQNYVYTKLVLPERPNDFNITLTIDWWKNGTYEVQVHDFNATTVPPFDGSKPFVFQKVGPPRPGSLTPEVFVAVVPEPGVHEWQITVTCPRGMNVTIGGVLTHGGTPIATFGFTTYLVLRLPLGCYPNPGQNPYTYMYKDAPTGRQCQVVTTPNCKVVNDWSFQIFVDINYPADGGYDFSWTVSELILQFPYVWTSPSPIAGKVTVEITEVQNHRYLQMGGVILSSGMLDASVFPWPIAEPIEPYFGSTLPYATRLPYVTPGFMKNNITSTQVDPITGLVELSVLAFDWVTKTSAYQGMDHIYYSPRLKTWLEVATTMLEQGWGWLWTGSGKNPELGQMDVDIMTFGNDTGVYFLGPDRTPATGDDIFISGNVTNYALPLPGSADWYRLCGPDGVPGTIDDPPGTWGDGDLDGVRDPDPPGSCILIVPGYLTTWILRDPDGPGPLPLGWYPLFSCPWPQPFTTGKATHVVIENKSEMLGASQIMGTPPFGPYPSPPYPDHTNTTYVLGMTANWGASGLSLDYRGHGEPQEFIASHPDCWNATFKHPKCNAFMGLTSAWSCMNVSTTLAAAYPSPHPGTVDLDSFYITELHSVREDLAIRGDMDLSTMVDSTDDGMFGAAWGARDELFPYYPNATGFPPYAGRFDARADYWPDGIIDSTDDGIFGAYWGKHLWWADP